MSSITEYDVAWKATLETFLQPCLVLAFPALADQIDWSVPPRFLDTELHEIVRDSESGPMRVDKLVEVVRRDGATELLLVHIEVQAQRDDDLPRRMFQYFCRIFDRFGRPPVSLAVLADPNPRWRPEPFTRCFADCSLHFQYATCKLTDLHLEPWIAAGNPVARVIEAHRMAQRTGKDVRGRRQGKLGLVRQLLESGMEEAGVREVMRLIHWLLALPEEEELGFRKDVRDMETSMQTKRRSTYERIVWQEGVERGLAQGRDEGRQEGRQEGRREGQLEGRIEGRHSAARELLLDLVRVRFGTCASPLRDRIEAIQDEARLRELALAVVTVSSLSVFEALAVE